MTMTATRITSDWHIHSQNSCDGACMLVSDLVQKAAEKGIADYGLTDHIHTPYNLPDLVASRKEFLSNSPSPHFHFGTEASCVSQWEIEEVAAGKHRRPTYGLRKGGPAGAPLEALRLELRQAVAGVIKRNRRLAALIGLHRRINTDICQLVLGCDNPEQVESGGALIDAEA